MVMFFLLSPAAAGLAVWRKQLRQQCNGSALDAVLVECPQNVSIIWRRTRQSSATGHAVIKIASHALGRSDL